MIGYGAVIRREMKAIGQPLPCLGELAGLAAIEVHAVDLADAVAHDLHQQAFVAK